MNLTQLSYMTFDEILEYVISSYIREFRERKFKTILDKIMTSNKISGLISTAKGNISPTKCPPIEMGQMGKGIV